MTRHRPRKSERRQSELARQMAGDFDAAPIHNHIADTVSEDATLARLLDAKVAADYAAKARAETVADTHESVEDIREGAGRLSYIARERALEVVAECCAEMVEEGDEWTDVWDADKINAAKIEAGCWLERHTNEATRAGVMDALAD